MPDTRPSPAPRASHGQRQPWFYVNFLLLATAALAINSSSLWIDECVTAQLARHPDLIQMWRDVLATKASEVQMPFYVTFMWGYEKVFGHSELALRLSGLPFFLAGMLILVTAAARRWGQCWSMAIAVSLSPFAWYYLNEARPYAIQMGLSAMIAAALMRLSEAEAPGDNVESRWLGAFLAGVVLLSGMSMLGQLWTGAALLAVFVVVPRARWLGWWQKHRAMLLTATLALLLLGGYYLWSLTLGARATAVGQTNLQTTLFVAYEQLGFAGLGPGRVELRAAGAGALKPFAGQLALFAGLCGLVLLAGLRQLWQDTGPRRLVALCGCMALPSCLILLAGVATHFRVLGRHLTPLTVVVLLVLGAGLLRLWRSPGVLRKSIAAGFIGLTAVSCLLIRFAPHHKKDDCRQAAAVAKAALSHGEAVWWNAANVAAAYYEVPLTPQPEQSGKALLVAGPQPGFADELSKPDLVITSKPDVYDPQGVLQRYLAKNNYNMVASFMAFQVWEKPL